MNIHGQVERTVALGSIIAIGNSGGIPATFLFQQREAPFYPTGYGTSLAYVVATMLLSALYAGVCWHENRQILHKRSRVAREATTYSVKPDVAHTEIDESNDRMLNVI